MGESTGEFDQSGHGVDPLRSDQHYLKIRERNAAEQQLIATLPQLCLESFSLKQLEFAGYCTQKQAAPGVFSQ